jgi:hypothetical protein
MATTFGRRIGRGAFGSVHVKGKDKIVKVQVISDETHDYPEDLLKSCTRETEMQQLCASHNIAPRIFWVKQYDTKVCYSGKKIMVSSLHKVRAQELLDEVSALCDDIHGETQARPSEPDTGRYKPVTVTDRVKVHGLPKLQLAKQKLQDAVDTMAQDDANKDRKVPATLYVIAMHRCQVTLFDFMKQHISAGNRVYLNAKPIEHVKEYTVTAVTGGDEPRITNRNRVLLDGKKKPVMANDCRNVINYLPLEDAHKIVSVMAQMDKLGLEHGDFKGNNIMREKLTGASEWKLIDFGYTQKIDPHVLRNMHAHGAKLNVIIALATLLPESFTYEGAVFDRKGKVLPLPKATITGATYLAQPNTMCVQGPDETLDYIHAELKQQIQCWRSMTVPRAWYDVFRNNVHLRECLTQPQTQTLKW